MTEDKIYKTSDMDIAAYLKANNLKLLRCDKNFYFVFEDPDGEAETLALEYANSITARFAAEIRLLKKMMYNKK
jgi:hypothetical protein